MTFSLQLMTGVLAQNEPRQTGPDFGKASPFGLIVLVLLLLGTFALVWSMNRHLRRLPESFDTENQQGGTQGADGRDPVNENRTDGAPGIDPDTAGPQADRTPRGPV